MTHSTSQPEGTRYMSAAAREHPIVDSTGTGAYYPRESESDTRMRLTPAELFWYWLANIFMLGLPYLATVILKKADIKTYGG